MAMKRVLDEQAEEKLFEEKRKKKLEDKAKTAAILQKIRYDRIERFGLAFVEKEEAEKA